MAATVRDTVNSLLDMLHLSSNHTAAPPREPTKEELDALRQKFNEANQGHVFAFYDSLTGSEKGVFYDQLSSIDPHHINAIVNKALHPSRDANDSQETTLEPLPKSATASIFDSDKEAIVKWNGYGLELIAENKVAVVLMAGGQGTRLGSSAPKGCYNIGLPSQKSLFQIQAERIIRLQHLAQKRHGKDRAIIPWYIMTSGPTRIPTEKFFEEHKYFGLDKKNVMIFEQGVLPCISNEGKILLESKSKVRLSPISNSQGLTTTSGGSGPGRQWWII